MMFELVRANKRRSMILLMVMLVLLLALGFAVGSTLIPSIGASEYRDGNVKPKLGFDPGGGFIGIGVAFCIWMAQSLVAYYKGDKILLGVSRAREIQKEDHPQLFNVVEEMTIAAQLPKMPRVYIIDDMALNAFATGRTPENAAVAVTAGLLGKLNRDQLQGVMAHEISHITHRDVLFMTMVGIMLGTIVMIAEVFLRSLWYGGATRRYRSDSKGGGGAQAAMMVVAVVLAILAPILAQLIYFAISRKREYMADAGAAVYTRYPEGLASALEVLAGDTQKLAHANRATAPMYIINPLHKKGAMALNLTRTHPPIEQRIKILRSIAGGVSYGKYQEAYQQASGSGKGLLPASALAGEAAAIRNPSGGGAGGKKDQRQRMREAGDLLRKVNEFIFLPCACGMRVKLPPEFKQESVQCPRCRSRLEVPVAQIAALEAAGQELSKGAGKGNAGGAPLEVTHHRRGWESFKCSCGKVNSLAPNCAAEHTRCTGCGRTVGITYAGK